MKSAYRSRGLADLAAQLVRSPARLCLRRLNNIAFLLSLIEDDKRYPTHFVEQTLTGLPAPKLREPVESNDDEIPADVLRIDLVLLAEQLSEAGRIPLEAVSDRVFTVSDLAERFDVSTKTIFRWHRRGLLGWRLRYPDGRARLAFPQNSVRRFVAENADLVRRGSSFSQLSRTERNTMIDRAHALVREDGGRTVNAVAKVIADETGRAVETIRLTLKAYDDARPKRGIFNRASLTVDADDVRLRVWEGHVEGASIRQLAERFNKSTKQIYAIVTEMRARERKREPIAFVPSDEFVDPNAKAIAFDDPALKNPHGDASPMKRIPRDLPPYLQHLFRLPLLSPAGEVALFRKMNFLRFQAEEARLRLQPESATASDLDAIESLLDDAEKVKNQIVQANLRLVVSIAKRHATPNRDFFEIVSDGNISLMRAVDKFDYSRGFKFSTYASWAIMKNYARSIPEQRIDRERYQTGREELLEHFAGPATEEHELQTHLELRGRLGRMLSVLPEREREILKLRFGIDGAGEPQTLEQVGKSFGVSKERIRQLEARAMQQLRDTFAEQADAVLES